MSLLAELRRRLGRLGPGVVLVIGVVGGVAIAVWGPRLWGYVSAPGDPPAAQNTSAPAPAVSTGASPRPLASPGTVEAGPGDSPTDAVRGFLAAEAAVDLTSSYSYLSEASREPFRSVDGWIADHADVLAPVRDFRLVSSQLVSSDASGAGEQAEVVTEVFFRSDLNTVTGLTPARVRATWPVVQNDAGGWLVDLASAEFRPQYPPEDAAVAAARDWLTSEQACGDGSGRLLGDRPLAEQLCGAGPPVSVRSPTSLTVTERQRFVTAYGPDAPSWARVIPVTEPAAARLVLAPVGDGWTVIAVLPPTASTS